MALGLSASAGCAVPFDPPEGDHVSDLTGGGFTPGVHFAYDPDDPGHADVLEMFAGSPGYSVELASNDMPSWHPGRRDNLRGLADAGFEVILRLDHRGRVNVPPTDGDIPAYLDLAVNEFAAPLAGDVDVFVIGNEPNLDFECIEGRDGCTPAHVATVYRAARAAIHDANPDATVLLPGVSPGGVDGGRYMSGPDYLAALMDELEVDEVDGFALHAYGGGDLGASVAMFEADLAAQLDLIAERGFASRPVYVTELDRATTSDADEAISARFLRRAYAFMAESSGRAGWPRIVTGCWYVYKSGNGEVSLRSLKSAGGDADTDLWHAFRGVASGEPVEPPTIATRPIHRAYSHGATDHLYTASLGEIEAAPGYALEHEGYFALRVEPGSSLRPLYRCWIGSATDHFYTTESDCEGAPGAVREGILGYLRESPGEETVPLHRLNRPGHDHFYTVSADERAEAVATHGYVYEGVAGHVWRRGS